MSPRLRRLTRGARCGRSAYLGCLRYLWSCLVPGESTCCWARMSDKLMEKKFGTRRAKEDEDGLAAERRYVEVRRFMVSGVRRADRGDTESERKGQKYKWGGGGMSEEGMGAVVSAHPKRSTGKWVSTQRVGGGRAGA